MRLIAALLLTHTVFALTPERARNGMVVAEDPVAADAGLQTLKAGGNAVDAAVATAFALAVSHPVAGNLGGGGFALIRMADGRVTFVDFREKAPKAASRDMYLGPDGKVTRDSLDGWRASGVPGTVRGLELMQKKFGSRPWSANLRPALTLASRGFALPYGEAERLNRSAKRLSRDPESNRIFVRAEPGWQAGDRLRQPDLARTLRRIAKSGAREFYEGETARLLARAMAANGGLITLEDLKAYNAVEREPIRGKYNGYDILTAPPPSSGGIGLMQMMGVLEGSGYEKGGWGSASHLHFLAETMRRFYADRSEYMGDPDFYKVPVKALLDPRYIAQLRNSIDREHASRSENVRPGQLTAYESPETTHISIVDKQGNAVALTYTLNSGFGSGVTAPRLGFLLNNEMDDFASKPGTANVYGLIQGESNAIVPGKRPLSAMTPTIVLNDGKLDMVVGAPGGSRIITAVLLTILNHLDFGMNVRDSVDAPRIHHQWMPDQIFVDSTVSPDTMAILRKMGHTLRPIDMTEYTGSARVFAIVVEPSGWLTGWADGRIYGKAAGY
jgi:gamma-glutamyltranspeptidase/glutathione hydrolase